MLVALWLGLTTNIASAETLAAPLPSIYAPSDTYALTINGTRVPVVRFSDDYDYAVASVPAGPSTYDVARVDGKPIDGVSVSPLKLEIATRTAGPRASFIVDGPRYLIINAAGLRRLVIATDPIDSERPARRGPGKHDVSAAPYAADPTGKTFSTRAIQSAIDAAGAEKGLVYVPAGVYRVSQLRLVSDVSIYLEAGAVLRCDGDADDFDVRFKKKSTGHDGFWFIAATGVQNVRLYGRGTIDGNGKALVKRVKLLNHLLTIVDCTNVRIDGLVLRDSGLWGTVIGNSTGVALANTKHFNFLDIGEDDCVDVCNSRDVMVARSIAISLDDPYSVKTWEPTTDVASQWTGEFGESRNVRFNDCFAWTRCFAFKIGAGVLRTQSDIRVSDSVVYDGAHAIGISHSYGRADVRDVTFERIDVERISCDVLGRSWARIIIDNRKKDSTAGGIHGVTVRDLNVRDAGTTPVQVQGLNDSRQVSGVFFERIRMPSRAGFAATLEEIGISSTRFATDVTVVTSPSTRPAPR